VLSVHGMNGMISSAEKQDQQERLRAINSFASCLFQQECIRTGVPECLEDARRLIEKCFNAAETMHDYLRERFEPFI
jgi:hypothetical protein